MQEPALRRIAHWLDQHNKGWLSNSKPLVLLFAGPSRVGKTETAKQIAQIISPQLQDSQQHIIHVGQYQLEQECARLNGCPPGYTGSPHGALAFLDQCIRPVVILDEIEKAHPKCLNFFLSVFDDGQFATGDGKMIDCKSAVFIMTSNVGQDVLVKKAASIAQLSCESQQRFGDEELRPLFLEKGWKPEFWNRIDDCVPFLPLSRSARLEGAAHFLKVQKVLVCLGCHTNQCRATGCLSASSIHCGIWLSATDHIMLCVWCIHLM